MEQETKLKDIFYELRSKHNPAILDEEDSLSVIYKGVKFIMEDEEVKILSTERDIYQEVTEDVYKAFGRGIDYGIAYFRVARYKRIVENYQEDTTHYVNAKKRLDESIRAIEGR